TRVEASATGNPSSQGGPLPVRAAFQEMAIPGAVTLAPADYLSAAAPTIDLNAVSQLSVTLPIWRSKLGHTGSAAAFRAQASLGPDHYLNRFVRPGGAGDTASVTLHLPDLRNLADWTTDMELTGRAEVDWVLSVIDQDQPLDAPFGQGRIGVESTLSGKMVP